MAVEQLRLEADPQTERRRADFGYELLEGVRGVSEPSAELPIEPVRGA